MKTDSFENTEMKGYFITPKRSKSHTSSMFMQHVTSGCQTRSNVHKFTLNFAIQVLFLFIKLSVMIEEWQKVGFKQMKVSPKSKFYTVNLNLVFGFQLLLADERQRF